MMKKLMLSAAVGALMIGGAMAQSTTPSPSATPDASASPSSTASTPPAAASGTISKQKPDQWLASKFKGTDVVGADNQKIGDVTDILFDKNGKIEAYVVSVGGFLGIGSKHVALPPSSFQVMAADASSGGFDKLKLSMSKDQLKQAANFEPYNPPLPRQTTGSGLGGSGGMATRPSTNTPPASTGK